MTREEAKKLLPIIAAFAEGKEVQVRQVSGHWTTIVNPAFGDGPDNYRIKSEPRVLYALLDSNGKSLGAATDLDCLVRWKNTFNAGGELVEFTEKTAQWKY